MVMLSTISPDRTISSAAAKEKRRMAMNSVSSGRIGAGTSASPRKSARSPP